MEVRWKLRFVEERAGGEEMEERVEGEGETGVRDSVGGCEVDKDAEGVDDVAGEQRGCCVLRVCVVLPILVCGS